MPATTETATIVFTDLAGSTELRSSLGEGAADELRRAHDAALAAAVKAHGGRVVKGAGDGILAAFPSASDAASAAVAMQQAVHELGRMRRLRLVIRIGVSAGDVSWEDGDCFGLPVVEAARLQAAALPGQILCSVVVRMLARGRGGAEFGPVTALELRGLDEPVEACEIAWAPAAPDRTRLPWVGREHELALVMDRWKRATTGSGSIVLIAGEPGIGKTRLMEEAAERVAAAGGAVWWGAAYEGEGRAYGPVTEMLDDHLRTVDVDTLRRQLEGRADLVARVAPRLQGVLDLGRPISASPEAERERTVDGIVEFAAAVGAGTPLLVVVDDAHWADASTIGVLRTLARRATRLPVLVLVAYRDVELDGRHPLADTLATWRRDPSVTRIVLGGLDEPAVTSLLGALADQEVSDAFAKALATETGGNPFFLREVILHLVESGRVRQEDGRWVSDPVGELGIPEGVREVIGRRLSRLSSEANRLLAAASVFDAAFELGDVAVLAGLSEDGALDAVDVALRAQLVHAADGFDRYEFAHVLIRHTLWAELSPSRQVRLHRAAAERIEERTGGQVGPAEAIALARHFHHSATMAGAERGVAYALVGANDAALRYAASEEHQALTIALELLPPGDQRHAFLQQRAAKAAILSADIPTGIEHARQAIGGALAASGPVAACRLAVELGRMSDTVELDTGWRFGHLVDDHRAVLDPAGMEAVQLLAWDVMEREFLDPDNPGIAVDSPERRHLNELAGGLPVEARPSGSAGYCFPSAAAVLADYPRAPDHLAWTLGFGGVGQYREAALALRQQADERLATGYVTYALTLLGMLGRLHLVLGELDRAAAVQAEGAELLDRVEPASNATVQYESIESFRLQLVDRDHTEALRRVAPVVEMSNRADLRWVSGPLRIWAAYLKTAAGDHKQGVRELVATLPVIERGMLGAPNYPVILHYMTAGFWLAGDAAHLDVLEVNLHAKVLEPDFSYAESDGRWTAALLCAMTGRTDEARRWFQRSLDRLTDQGAILLLPHVCCDAAQMEVHLGPAGDRRHGLARLDDAQRWADRIGLPSFEPVIGDLRVQLPS